MNMISYKSCISIGAASVTAVFSSAAQPADYVKVKGQAGKWYDVSQWYPEKVKELLELAVRARSDLGDDLTKTPGANRRMPGRI